MTGQTYDISNSGTNPIMTIKEVFTPGASVQDRWMGSDYLEPETQKQHSAYVYVRTNSSAIDVIGPGSWTQVSTQSYDYEENALARWAMQFLVSAHPFRWVFCNDIFAVANK